MDIQEQVEFWYEMPTQVSYFSLDDSSCYKYGIALHEFIIDFATGALYKNQDVLAHAKQSGMTYDDAIIELAWLPLEC